LCALGRIAQRLFLLQRHQQRLLCQILGRVRVARDLRAEAH
jgi:hypothetical protein